MKNQKFNESITLLKKLNCIFKYFNSENIYWYENNPTLAFKINDTGDISIINVFSHGESEVLIGDIFNDFNEEQKKEIIYNLDKFR